MLAVLNPRGKDPFISYEQGPGSYKPGIHPPVNFHAYAAATGGAFCQEVEQVMEDSRFRLCLLLLRRRIAPCLEAIRRLKDAGLPVLVSWKETGHTQLAAQLADPALWPPYSEILALADGVLSPTLVPFPLPPLPSASDLPFLPIPTPYPLEAKDWDYSRPIEERSGIFLGTREFFQPARNHLAALTLALREAERHDTHVTLVQSEKAKGRKLLHRLVPSGQRLRVIEGRLPYDDYLRLISAHRLVFQLDRSGVPGQVAGDTLLCRSLCLGGDSAIERLAFSHEPGETPTSNRLSRLLEDDQALQESIDQSQKKAKKRLTYQRVAKELETATSHFAT
ncbi:MAG: hypothetical protein AAF191_14500 [Verrucomicrobiota bacterium]